MSILDELSRLKDEPAWLLHYEGPLGGHGWALALGPTVPEPADGTILAAYAVPDHLRHAHVTALKAMARNGTLTKVEAQHG